MVNRLCLGCIGLATQVSELQGKQKLAVTVTSGLKDLVGMSSNRYIYISLVRPLFRDREAWHLPFIHHTQY